MALVLWSGRTIRAFFLLRAIDFVLTRPRRELSARPAHRVFQFLLFVTFLPCLFAGPVVLFNDFYRPTCPASLAARSALLPNAAKIVWGALKFYALGPVVQRAVESLHLWAYEGGGPSGLGPRALMWGFLFLQVVDTFVRFSGFTDMAIGVSRLLGFQLYENFTSPAAGDEPPAVLAELARLRLPLADDPRLLPVLGALADPPQDPDHVPGQRPVALQHRAEAELRHRGRSSWARVCCTASGSGWWPRPGAARGRRHPPSGRRASRLVRRIAATAATFVFVSFVHLVFRAGLSGRPLHSTWSDLTLLLGPTVEAEPVAARTIATASTR